MLLYAVVYYNILSYIIQDFVIFDYTISHLRWTTDIRSFWSLKLKKKTKLEKTTTNTSYTVLA